MTVKTCGDGNVTEEHNIREDVKKRLVVIGERKKNIIRIENKLSLLITTM